MKVEGNRQIVGKVCGKMNGKRLFTCGRPVDLGRALGGRCHGNNKSRNSAPKPCCLGCLCWICCHQTMDTYQSLALDPGASPKLVQCVYV